METKDTKTAEEFLNDDLKGTHQTFTEDGITLITGIEHSEVCRIIEEYHQSQSKQMQERIKELEEERKNILKNIKTYDLTAKADEYNSQTPEFYIDEELCIKGGDWIKYEDLEKALNK